MQPAAVQRNPASVPSKPTSPQLKRAAAPPGLAGQPKPAAEPKQVSAQFEAKVVQQVLQQGSGAPQSSGSALSSPTTGDKYVSVSAKADSAAGPAELVSTSVEPGLHSAKPIVTSAETGPVTAESSPSSAKSGPLPAGPSTAPVPSEPSAAEDGPAAVDKPSPPAVRPLCADIQCGSATRPTCAAPPVAAAGPADFVHHTPGGASGAPGGGDRRAGRRRG